MYYAKAIIGGKEDLIVHDLGKNIRGAKTKAYQKLSYLLKDRGDYITILKEGKTGSFAQYATMRNTNTRCWL